MGMKEISEEEYTALTTAKTELETLKSKSKDEPPPPPPKDDKGDDDDDLHTKATKGRKTEEEKRAETKLLEGAIKFTMGLEGFVKDHTDLLPADIQQILKVAEKESYDSTVEKSNAVKSAFIQSFFSVQSNVELLTPANKAALDDYLKLTKSGKDQKAPQVYEQIFEPALEMSKRLKKADELGKSRGHLHTHTTVEAAYIDRLVKGSRQTHLGEKGVEK